MPDADLGPKPDPEIEPGEPNPGGVDAIDHGDGVDGESADGDPVPADLDPQDNPATQGEPDEVQEDEDTSTKATQQMSDEDNTGGADEADRENPV
ncbi:hypothetical protein [Nocardioides sp. cx-173]|uniref:hypothetical protein n=1 Tax=Nocardioides sp. cx-173 TaxID=2898796 RepID=UPI001E6538DD|nr:hypothetical protein [Nocardioides sp. cx-173]MCD4527085.1 hypothetical protein [Nocardioides sp. cx-173]UGB42449.1 hypothetical protein LQ940_02740 [Nocardioides sp. cx-173]